MADTYSDRLGLIKIEPGTQTNEWGTLLNINFDRLDSAIRGYKLITLAGAESLDANDILTTSSVGQEESFFKFIEFRGTAGTVTVPAEDIFWIVYNNTGSNFTFQPSGGTGVPLVNGRVHFIVYGSSGASFVDVTTLLNITQLPAQTNLAVDNISIDGNTITTTSGGLTLDSTTGTITVAGTVAITGNQLTVGVNDSVSGNIDLYGGSTGNEGGQLNLYTTAGYDTTVDRYFIDAYQDTLRIVADGVGAALTIDSSQNATFAGTVDVSGTDVTLTNATNPEFIVTDTTNTITTALQSTDAVGVVGTKTAHPFYLKSNNITAVQIDTSQNATFVGTVIAPAATTSIPSARLPHGTAPSSPTNGDLWTTTSGVFARINGVSQNLLDGAGDVSASGTPVNNELAVWTNASTIEGEPSLTFNSANDRLTVGAGASGAASPQIDIDAQATGVPTISFNQAGVQMAAISYVDADDMLAIQSDFEIEFRPGNVGDWGIFSTTSAKLGNYTFNTDQTVGAGQDNYALVYDNGSGEIGLEPTGAGDVVKVGTPVNNQLGVWTGDGTIEGDANLTWNGSTLTASAFSGAGTGLTGTAASLTVSNFTAGSVDQTAIAANAVGQSEIKTTFQSITSAQEFTATGGIYVMGHTMQGDDTLVPAAWNDYNLLFRRYSTDTPAFAARWWWQAVDPGDNDDVRLYYINSSPPYDLGDGNIPLFAYALMDNATAEISALNIAPDPIWAYNGPTDITPSRYAEDGKTYRKMKDMSGFNMTYEQARAAGGTAVRDYLQAFSDASWIEEEITQTLKNADKDVVPHPWVGNHPSFFAGKTLVMLDPVADSLWKLYEFMDHKDVYISDLLRNYFNIGNSNLSRRGPNGVMIVSADWK